MCMITKVLDKKNQTKSKKDVFDELLGLYPNDPYAKQKAAGAVGGSVTQNYIEEQGVNYRCTRDAEKVATA